MQAKLYHMVPITHNKFKNRQESLMVISQPCGFHGGGGAGGGGEQNWPRRGTGKILERSRCFVSRSGWSCLEPTELFL